MASSRSTSTEVGYSLSGGLATLVDRVSVKQLSRFYDLLVKVIESLKLGQLAVKVRITPVLLYFSFLLQILIKVILLPVCAWLLLLLSQHVDIILRLCVVNLPEKHLFRGLGKRIGVIRYFHY